MKLEKTITVPVPEEAIRRRLTHFMTQEGYRPSNNSDALCFERGSLLGSFTAFSPKGWQAKVRIQLSENYGGTTAQVTFNINTTGQMVTAKEREFWDAELAAIEMAMSSENESVETQANLNKAALNENVSTAIVFLIFTIAIDLLWVVMAHMLFDSRAIARIGTVVIVAIATAIFTKYLKVW